MNFNVLVLLTVTFINLFDEEFIFAQQQPTRWRSGYGLNHHASDSAAPALTQQGQELGAHITDSDRGLRRLTGLYVDEGVAEAGISPSAVEIYAKRDGLGIADDER